MVGKFPTQNLSFRGIPKNREYFELMQRGLKTNCRVHRQEVKLNKCADRDGHGDCPSNDNKPTGRYRDGLRQGTLNPIVTGGFTI